ncbi:MAG: precorrin-6A/cobalt-precorrin-6A reductase [Oleispira sp.]
MKILILGGTSEAKSLAEQLINLGAEIIYSIAGLVRQPVLNCKIICGGFSQYNNDSHNAKKTDGLTAYLLAEKINCLVDATHPFATKMSQQANRSAQEINIPCISFIRPEWEKQEGDDWSLLENEDQLLNKLALAVNTGSKNIFYTNGQIGRKLALELDAIAELNEAFGQAQYIVRSAKETELPQYSQWIQAIGPFNIEDEKSLLEKYEIDLIVCKNSGGEATKAKLEAARELNVRVLMLQRPKIVNDSSNDMNKVFHTLDECFEFISEKCSSDFC